MLQMAVRFVAGFRFVAVMLLVILLQSRLLWFYVAAAVGWAVVKITALTFDHGLASYLLGWLACLLAGLLLAGWIFAGNSQQQKQLQQE